MAETALGKRHVATGLAGRKRFRHQELRARPVRRAARVRWARMGRRSRHAGSEGDALEPLQAEIVAPVSLRMRRTNMSSLRSRSNCRACNAHMSTEMPPPSKFSTSEALITLIYLDVERRRQDQSCHYIGTNGRRRALGRIQDVLIDNGSQKL